MLKKYSEDTLRSEGYYAAVQCRMCPDPFCSGGKSCIGYSCFSEVDSQPRVKSTAQIVDSSDSSLQKREIDSPQTTVSLIDREQDRLMAEKVDLEAIKGVNGNIREIRLLLRGNVDACLRLFREAIEQDDVVTQIQLSYAWYGMRRGKDKDRDFFDLVVNDLEDIYYYFSEFGLFSSAYNEALSLKIDVCEHKKRGIEAFKKASDLGYLPAVLELSCTKWSLQIDHNSYGLAVELRPYLGKGDKHLDYYFGGALKNGSAMGSKLFYEGMYWQEMSLGYDVKYPSDDESFKSFIYRYQESENLFIGNCYSLDGLYHVSFSDVRRDVILAPSKAAWEDFKDEKFKNIECALPESYFFDYDVEQIRHILNYYKIRCFVTGGFVENNRWVSIICLSADRNDIGKISVYEDTFEIYASIKDENIQPVIDFVENIMKRCGSAESVYGWLNQFGSRYI